MNKDPLIHAREIEMCKKLSIQKGRLELEMETWCPIVRPKYGESFEEARLREYVTMRIQADPDHSEEIKEEIRRILEK